MSEPADENLAMQWERRILVRESLEELGSPCRELLSAMFLDVGPTDYDLIAKRLRLPRGSIGPMRGRCFETLRAILIRQGFEPPTPDETG